MSWRLSRLSGQVPTLWRVEIKERVNALAVDFIEALQIDVCFKMWTLISHLQLNFLYNHLVQFDGRVSVTCACTADNLRWSFDRYKSRNFAYCSFPGDILYNVGPNSEGALNQTTNATRRKDMFFKLNNPNWSCKQRGVSINHSTDYCNVDFNWKPLEVQRTRSRIQRPSQIKMVVYALAYIRRLVWMQIAVCCNEVVPSWVCWRPSYADRVLKGIGVTSSRT